MAGLRTWALERRRDRQKWRRTEKNHSIPGNSFPSKRFKGKVFQFILGVRARRNVNTDIKIPGTLRIGSSSGDRDRVSNRSSLVCCRRGQATIRERSHSQLKLRVIIYLNSRKASNIQRKSSRLIDAEKPLPVSAAPIVPDVMNFGTRQVYGQKELQMKLYITNYSCIGKRKILYSR